MCGIVGYFSASGYQDSLEEKLKILEHRGPDGQNKYYLNSNVNVGLGHVRLSIIDLSNAANQPFHSKCNDYTIIFNGEIYNYKELKNKYLSDVDFKTNSDTEVLLNLYIKLKEKALQLLEGMFAFAIYNHKDQSVFIARDQIGIKPLYYYKDDKKLIFSSEIKAIWKFKDVEKKIDYNLLPEFLLNGFIYEPDTGYQNVKKIPLGSYALINKDSFKITEYWNPKDFLNKPVNKNINHFENLIEQSIKSHLVSDVPLGLFYSGGVDSTIILDKVKNQIDPVVVKSNENEVTESGSTNDYHYAKTIANNLNIPLKEILLDQTITSNQDFLESINQLSIETEEPISDYTFLSSKIISRKSKELNYKVMLSGMGADEVFAGYPRYLLLKFNLFFSAVNRLIPSKLLKVKSFDKKINRFKTYFKESNFAFKYASLVGYFSKNQLNSLFLNTPSYIEYEAKIDNILKSVSQNDKVKNALILDLYGYLAHNFSVADKSSMLESIEIRVPLATAKLYQNTLPLSTKHLIRFKNTKFILKKLLEKSGFSKNIIYRKKAGFNPPLDTKIRNLGQKNIIDIFEKNEFFNYFNKIEINNILTQHFNKSENNTYQIFQLLYLSYWLKNNR